MLGHQTQRKAENLIDAGMKSVVSTWEERENNNNSSSSGSSAAIVLFLLTVIILNSGANTSFVQTSHRQPPPTNDNMKTAKHVWLMLVVFFVKVCHGTAAKFVPERVWIS